MSDNPVQPEAWNGAGRTAALLFAIVCFAAIWEADSNRNQPGQFASETGTPPVLSQVRTDKPIEIGNFPSTESPLIPATVELDQTLKRESGLVRIRLQIEPVTPIDRLARSQQSELVCKGNVDDIRSELLTLLKQLDETSRIIPASATTSKKPKTSHRGFTFLSRRPEIAKAEPPVDIGVSISEPIKSAKPELLDSSVRIGIR